MSMIVSSNRSRAEWAKLIERPFDPEFEMRQTPHQPAEVLIARHAIVPAAMPGVDLAPVDEEDDEDVEDPFAHVIAVDECGAPIHGGTTGAAATIARLSQ